MSAREPSPLPWRITLICCGREDGYSDRATWEEADALRQSYISAEGHERSAVITLNPDALASLRAWALQPPNEPLFNGAPSQEVVDQTILALLEAHEQRERLKDPPTLDRVSASSVIDIVEPDDKEARGYAVWAGCEGDCPRFVAFFVHEEHAEAFVEVPHPEEPESPIVGDSAVVVAVLTEHGIISANSYKIEAHEQLEATIREQLKRSAKL